MRRAWIPVLCILLQLLSVTSGQAVHRSGWMTLVGDAAWLLSGVALFWRGRDPWAVLGTTTVAYAAQAVLGGPVLPAAVAVATETFARRAVGDKRSAPLAAALIAVALIGVAAAAVIGGSAFLAAPFAVVLLAAALLGVLRSSRAAQEAASRRELVVAERLRIARDLHDVVGHGVGAIAVQAGAARMAIAAGALPEATRALVTIEAAGRGVLTEVRWLVGLLRDDAERPGLSDIATLIGNARRSGLDVDLHVDGQLTSAPNEVGEATYRIVQEALTNVLRHSGTHAATVEIRVADDLLVQVVDEGTSAQQFRGVVEGNGVRGIRERAEAVGGTVRIGPEVSGGWAVTARFALGSRPR